MFVKMAGYCPAKSSLPVQLARLLLGLVLCAVGVEMMVCGNVGLAPWDAFAMGISYHTGVAFGDMVILSGLLVIALDLILREKIGIGTLLNTLLVGKFVKLLEITGWIPQMHGLLSGTALVLCGHVFMALGMYFYMSIAWGCGPRDTLMVAVGRHFPKIPIGLAKFSVEAVVLSIGWALGAPVGVGTIISIVCGSFIVNEVFHLFRFDATAVAHADLLDSFRLLRRRFQHSAV